MDVWVGSALCSHPEYRDSGCCIDAECDNFYGLFLEGDDYTADGPDPDAYYDAKVDRELGV